MKTFVVFALFVALAAAAPTTSDKDAQTLGEENDNVGFGPFRYGYQTSNGISAQAQGEIADEGTEAEGLESRGSFEYTAPNGELIRVDWTAGRAGFNAVGKHLPQNP